MEKIKKMKDSLIESVQSQMGNLQHVDAHELGEVIDMIKDLEEVEYYCTIIKAMEGKEEEEKSASKYYTMRFLPVNNDEYYRDVDRPYGRMYYTEPVHSMPIGSSQMMPSVRKGNEGIHGYNEYVYPITMRDQCEGRSPMSRKTYMESKEMHKDSVVQMKELEQYLSELSQDITEMIQVASPEEKAILARKLSTLASKIN